MISRCSLCPCTKDRSPILPSGPSPSRIAFIGEAPAKYEDAQGIPFCGQTGQELDGQYLPLAGLERSQVAVCNSTYCSQPNYRNPTEEEALACSSKHLPGFLQRVQPSILVVMGSIANSLFPGTNLNIHHGIPREASFGSWSGILFPTFHPAAGLRSSQYMILIRSDMLALKALIADMDEWEKVWGEGCYSIQRLDPHPTPDYSVLRTVHDLSNYLRNHPYYEISVDTESRPDSSPFCLTLSHTPGTSRLIHASNKPVLNAFFSYLRTFRPLLSLHNYLHDASVFDALGYSIPPTRFIDTMVQSYELGLGGGGDEEESGGRGSLGLKVLAYRHLNMEMTSFIETVTPYTIPYVLDYFSAAESILQPPEVKVVCVCGHGQEMHASRGKSGNKTGSCLHGYSSGNLLEWNLCGCLKWKKAKPTKDVESGRLLSKIKNVSNALWLGKDVDPWKRVKEWHEWEKDLLQSLLGPLPVPDVSTIPEEALTYYACRDADATLRLRHFLNAYKPI